MYVGAFIFYFPQSGSATTTDQERPTPTHGDTSSTCSDTDREAIVAVSTATQRGSQVGNQFQAAIHCCYFNLGFEELGEQLREQNCTDLQSTKQTAQISR